MSRVPPVRHESSDNASPVFAYLLLTHKRPTQVEALADRLLALSPAAQIVVHHDSTAETVPWEGAPPDPMHLVERAPVRWGDWSMIEATLRLLRFGMDRTDADWFVLLSGEHWPVVDLEDWERTTALAGVDAIVRADPLPERLRFGRDVDDVNEYLARCVHRWVALDRPDSERVQRAFGGLMKLSRRTHPVFKLEFVHRRDCWALGVPRRRGPMHQWRFYRGSQWLAVNRRAATTLLRADAPVAEWFSKTWIPDETYLQTLLHNDPDLAVRNAATTFVLGTPSRPRPGWMRLDLKDLPAVRASGTPFARKVDPLERPEVLVAIDKSVDESRVVSRADTRRSPG